MRLQRALAGGVTASSAMTSPVDAVALLLAQWNPLEVPDGIAMSEYQFYAPKLCAKAREGRNLVPSLVEILEGMGIEESDLRSEHYAELQALNDQIKAIFDETSI